MLPRPAVFALLLAAVAFAGCASSSNDDPTTPTTPDTAVTPAVVPLDLANNSSPMTFRQSIVSAAQGVAQDLYEPTMEVSDTGAIYVAAHVIAAATTGTPSYVSNDDGKSWRQMPLLGPVGLPGVVQGGQPPPGDEGFFVAGDDGQVWMADIYAAGFSVTGWCGDGASQCYDNRQAYDRVKATSEFCADGVDPNASTAQSLNDRPWAAYTPGVGKLLLVNNPGGGPMQIGMLPVPPMLPVGTMDPVTGPVWNLCASPEGFIPGVPAMRADGLFAVPQMVYDSNVKDGDQSRLTVVTGNVANIFDVKVRDAFYVTNSYEGTTNGGRTAFDATGTLFVGAYNNTQPDKQDVIHGRFIIAASTDGGESFVNTTFTVPTTMRSLYLDSNPYGRGALLTWSELNAKDPNRSDWYAAHLDLAADGKPVLSDITLAVKAGPHSAAHVMGAGLGPDGRAYFVNFDNPGLPAYVLSTPLSVWIQDGGPRLPVTLAP